MATIKPFICILPSKEKAAKIAALPYDVYNRQEAKEVVKNNPDSFLKIDRAETQFLDTVSTYDEKVYQKAYETLQQMILQGDFVRKETAAYYIYELTMNGRTQTGIVACASIDDYQNGVIKKHENTREEKELDRIHHVDTCNAQTGPIFLAYRKQQAIEEIISTVKQNMPLFDFVSEDGIRHRVFEIEASEECRKIQNCFAQMNQIYIADGHHRAASAVKVGLKRRAQQKTYTGEEAFNYFLSVLFPGDELMILDYNRVLKDLNGRSCEEFLGEVKNIFSVTELPQRRKPGCKGEITMYLKDTWYLLKIREQDKSSDPVEGLDVSLLQNLLLKPIFHIEDPKTDNRIDFVGGIRGLEELESRVKTDSAVAFAMYPTSIEELFAVADAGRLMPPKSTWFEPKLRSGLFIHEI